MRITSNITLTGAPAVSASMYVIGAPVVAALGIAASLAVVGGAIVGGVALGVAAGVNWLSLTRI